MGAASAIDSGAVLGISTVLDGRYRLDERLGEGASGTVFRATHLGLSRAFALKVLKPGRAADAPSVARFRREAESLGRLRHPHVVTVTDSGLDPETGAPYLVMEFLEGPSLARVLQEEGPLPLERALPILGAIAAALDAAHEAGILHRDLKPANVLLAGEDGRDREVKVVDFGLADLAARPRGAMVAALPDAATEAGPSESLTATGALLGTPLYAAPEVIHGGRAGRPSDIYSFGVLAYEMLAGCPPFRGSTAEVLAGHLEREPPPPGPSLAPELWSVLREPLAKDPRLRPATAHEFVLRLRAAAARAREARWRRIEWPRRAWLSAGLALAVLVAGILFPAEGVPAGERWFHELRMGAAPTRRPDPRILLLTFDEASLGDSPLPLAGRAEEVGGILESVLAAGARAVAVDLLLPDQWSASQAFSDLVLHHPERLVLAAFSAPDGRVIGGGCVAGLTAAALGPERSQALFGLVNLEADGDGVIRRGRLAFRDRAGGERASWAARAAATIAPLPAGGGEADYWIDLRVDGSGFARISWRDVPTVLAREPAVFRDRLVLVGGDVAGAGDDAHRIPGGRRSTVVSSLVLQALMVNTVVTGLPVRQAPRGALLAAAALWTAAAAAIALLARRPAPLLAALALTGLLYLAASVPVARRTGLLLPATVPSLPAAGATLFALALRRVLRPSPSGGLAS